jgi:sugar phosphate isomerase/epimerase
VLVFLLKHGRIALLVFSALFKEINTTMKLGVNSVLFKVFSFAQAARAIKLAGYDGVEISAIEGMCEHLDLNNWAAQKSELIGAVEENELVFLSTEVASLDRDRLSKAFEACASIGIPIVNIGPGGVSDVPGNLEECIETLCDRAALAAGFGVQLCCKAHVGAAVYNTPTTLAAMKGVENSAFGIDMDPPAGAATSTLPRILR